MSQTGLTPLHLTAQEERVNAAEVLCKHDANLDQQTKVETKLLPYILEELRNQTRFGAVISSISSTCFRLFGRSLPVYVKI